MPTRDELKTWVAGWRGCAAKCTAQADEWQRQLDGMPVDPTPVPPNAPPLVTAVPTSPTSARVSWGDVVDATSFDVQVSLVPDFVSVVGSANIGRPVLSADVAGLTPSQTYYARVRAVNQVGLSPWANAPSFLTPSVPDPTPSNSLLRPEDFTLGTRFAVGNDVAEGLNWGMGLTHRFVNGQLRFLTFAYPGNNEAPGLVEFALPSSGQEVFRRTNYWPNIWGNNVPPRIGGGDEFSLKWDEPTKRLITTQCTDYPDDAGTTDVYGVSSRTLNPDGTVSNLTPLRGFQGVGRRALYGAPVRVPQWFRDKYKVGEWMWCEGGYTSRMGVGLTPSLGMFRLFGPDPTTYSGAVPTSDFKILADCRGGAQGRDWYPSRTPVEFDRGARNSDVTNYFDGGDQRSNPSSRPVTPPAAGAQWLSPAPDGKGRMVWSDSNYGTTAWIEGSKRRGVVSVWSLMGGAAYYMSSAPRCDRRLAELQITDPLTLGEVADGKRRPWQVQPSASKVYTSDDAAFTKLLYGIDGNAPAGGVAGATWVPETSTYYLWCTMVNHGPYNVLIPVKVDC